MSASPEVVMREHKFGPEMCAVSVWISGPHNPRTSSKRPASHSRPNPSVIIVRELIELSRLFGVSVAPGANAGFSRIIHCGPHEFAQNIRMILDEFLLLKRICWKGFRGHHDAGRDAFMVLGPMLRPDAHAPCPENHRHEHAAGLCGKTTVTS